MLRLYQHPKRRAQELIEKKPEEYHGKLFKFLDTWDIAHSEGKLGVALTIAEELEQYLNSKKELDWRDTWVNSISGISIPYPMHQLQCIMLSPDADSSLIGEKALPAKQQYPHFFRRLLNRIVRVGRLWQKR